MPIDIQPIPNLHGGVSQQSPTQRSPNQVERAKDCTFSVSKGAGKRSPVEIVNLLSSSDLSDNFYHFITDKFGDRFLLVAESEEISIYRLSDGQKLNVANDTGITYLNSATPGDSFRALTIQGDTYIVNTETTVTATASVVAGSIADTLQTLQDDITPVVDSIYEITGSANVEFDRYYAKYTGDGVFVEWAEPGISDELDQDTMPHIITIIYDEVDPFGVRFSIDPVTWEKRKVGDDKSNKFPSFIGNTITGLFTIHGRLGFLSQDSFTLGEVDEPTNFFRTSVVNVLDTDRIDLTAKEGKTSAFRWAKPLSKNVVIFTDNEQYFLSGDPVITPSTARLDLATKYQSEGRCEPQNAGANLFFPVATGNHSRIREMYIQDNIVTTDTADITAHVPSYVPKNLKALGVQNNLDYLCAFSSETPNSLWTYYYMYNGDQKVQSAWGEWKLPEGVEILDIEVVSNYLYIVFTATYTIDEILETTETSTYLGRINLKIDDVSDYDNPFPKPITLDFVSTASAIYDGINDRTLITHNFPIMAPEFRDDLVVVLGDGHEGFGRSYNYNTVYTFSPGATLYQFYLPGDTWVDGQIYVGLRYSQELEFSRQYYKQNVSMLNARIQIRNIVVGYVDTASFEVNVKVQGSDAVGVTYITELANTFSARQIGTEYFNLNSPSTKTDSRRFPVMGRAQDTVITLTNDTYIGANWVMAELESLITSRTRRV